ILYATRVLGLDGALVGAVYTIGGLASVFGASMVRRVTTQFGIGPSMSASIFLVAAGWALVLVAGGPPILAAGWLAGRSAVAGLAPPSSTSRHPLSFRPRSPTGCRAGSAAPGRCSASASPRGRPCRRLARAYRRSLEYARDLRWRPDPRPRLRRQLAAATHSHDRGSRAAPQR